MAIKELYETILARKDHPKEGSYTSSLFADGLPRMAQKVGEEGTEVVVAALSQEKARLVEELADLVYHALVLMAAKGVSPQDVAQELEKRRR